MFTGLIEEIGIIQSIKKNGLSLTVEIKSETLLKGCRIGDSIAVNGVCQTVTGMKNNSFTIEVSSTTLEKTSMSSYIKSTNVNLERAMKLEDRLGGHLVQGHVNGTARVISLSKDNSMYLLNIELDRKLMKYVIDEGSISIDGISLTVSEMQKNQNRVFLRVIPHTYNRTILKYKKPGDLVNIETDMIGRYVESLLTDSNEKKLTYKNLEKWGY